MFFKVKESDGAIYFDMLPWVVFVAYLRIGNQF